jgi:hypothetical protein
MNSATRQGCREYIEGGGVNSDQVAVDSQGGGLDRLFKKGVPSGEVWGRTSVEPLHISGGANFKRASNIDVEESGSPNNIADHPAMFAEGGNETADYNGTGVSNQGGGLSGSAEVLGSIIGGKTKPAGQPSSEGITIKGGSQESSGVKVANKSGGKSRLPGP